MHYAKHVVFSLLRTVLVLFGITLFIFIMVRIIPGDVVDMMALEGGLDAQMQAQLRQELGIAGSIPAQFVHWISQALHGDFGMSLRFHKPVVTMMADALPASLILSLTSFAFGFVLAGCMATLAIVYPRSIFARLVEIINIWSIAIPTFCAGLLCIAVFVFWLDWMPMLGNMYLAILVLGIDIAGQMVKPFYEELKELSSAKFVTTARTKGLTRMRIVYRHLLPNSLSVVFAMSGIVLGTVIGGTITLEVLFGISGFGKLTLTAIQGRDYALIQASVLLIASAVVCLNWLTDTMTHMFDPRRASFGRSSSS